MKMRKSKIKYIAAALSAVLLVSCGANKSPANTYGLSGSLPKGLLANNKSSYTENRFMGYTKVKSVTDYDGLSAAPSGSFATVYKNTPQGFRYGVYDLGRETELLPLQYTQISMQQRSYYHIGLRAFFAYRFAVVTDNDGKTGIFSLQENKFIMSVDDYFGYSFTVTTTNGITTERIETASANGSTDTMSTVTFDDNNNLVRAPIAALGSGDSVAVPTRTVYYANPKLKDYEYEIDARYLRGFKNGKSIFNIELPSMFIINEYNVDKYWIGQRFLEVDRDATNFSFTEAGNKYLLYTYRIDMTTGKFEEIKDFAYRFGHNIMLRDKNDVPAYMNMSVQKIENKVLLPEARILFDAKLKALVNLTNKEFGNSHYEVDTNMYYVADYQVVVDENYNVIANFKKYSNISFKVNEKLFSMQIDGRFGLVKPTGEIVVPFYYQNDFKFYNGSAFNIDTRTNKSYFISPTGETRLIVNENDFLYRNGLIYTTTLTHEVYKNYTGASLVSLDDTEFLQQSYEFYYNDLNITAGSVFITNKAGEKVMYVLS